MKSGAAPRALACLLATLAPGIACACEGLVVTDAWIREPPPGATAVAVYMTLENDGALEIAVNGLTSPQFARGMLHETIRDGDRVRMQHVAALTLAPGTSRSLAPGALHGMLIKPVHTMPQAGDAVDAMLACGERHLTLRIPVRRDAPTR